jgi:hypothetical protein
LRFSEQGATIHFTATFVGGFFVTKELIFAVSDLLENEELSENQQFRLVPIFSVF